jgi:HTH-type transcriptional regulator / antitoxin HigA
MRMISRQNPRPFRPVSPGEILREELEAHGWTQKELAERISRPYQAVNEIIRGRKQITAGTALALSSALGTSAEFWMNLETNYRLDIARRELRQRKRSKPAAA